MSMPAEGDEFDGFRIGTRIHAGAMARIYEVSYADGREPPFPMVMKVPLMREGDGSENIVSFEVEHQLLQVLHGPHVPRFVAAGDLHRVPYLVMEHVHGITLDAWMQSFRQAREPIPVDAIVRLGAGLAQAVHSLHQQNVCHLDLKPANVMVAAIGVDGERIVLLDFGLSCHSDYPDLLAEEFRKAVGSPTWIAPEQVVGMRGDLRSDIFAIGVMLYEMATGETPFGSPATTGGLRQRLWASPKPPRAWRPDLPEWLQEVILRCLEPQASQRYPSAAHLMFDLRNPGQVTVTERGKRIKGKGFWWHFKRWLRAAGMQYEPSPLPSQQISEVPIVMVAVPNYDVSDVAMYALRQATARSLGTRPGAQLAVVTVVNTGLFAGSEHKDKSETWLQRQHLAGFRKWADGLDLSGHQVSYHVIESNDVAQALLRYAEGNNVSLIIMGAATHGLSMQRFVATVPIKVAMHAPCTVVLVKEPMPFEQLAASIEEEASTAS